MTFFITSRCCNCCFAVVQLGEIQGDNPEEIKKQKAIKGLLNKITPEKFDKILNDIIAVGYETEQTESGLIDQVRFFFLVLVSLVNQAINQSMNQPVSVYICCPRDPQGRHTDHVNCCIFAFPT